MSMTKNGKIMRFNFNLREIILLLFFALIFFNAPSFAENSEIIYDRCSLMKMSGTKVGYFCTVQRQKIQNGTKYIITDRHFEQSIKRLGKTVKIIQDTNYVEEKESGNPVSFSSNMQSVDELIKVAGKFLTLHNVKADFDVNGVKTSKEVILKDKILFPYAIDNLYRYSEAKTVKYSTIEHGIDLREIKIETKKLEQESLSADGLNNKYNKYEVSLNILPGVKNYEWRDKNGRVVKEYDSLFKIELILANKNDVLNASYDNDNDFLSQNLISVNKPIGNPDLIDQINYKIKVFNVSTNNLFINDERQKITQVKDNEIYLKINTEKPETQKFPYPLETKELEEYLKNGPFIMPDSNKISDAAKLISSGETDAYVISKKMEKWVYDYLTGKDYSLDFANAVQVFETRAGDCTEHSVLLASLLRAAGIPSKVVVGLIYTDTPKPSFGYHMWVRAYVGKWVNLDAAMPYKNFVPIHIAMTESTLNNLSDRSDMLINLLKSFSNIKIEVLNADLPVVSKLDNGLFRVNLENDSGDSVIIENVNKQSKQDDTNYSGVNIVSLSGNNEQDPARSAYYNFIKGNIKQSLDDFKASYDSVSAEDDFGYMKLGLKLSGLGFFNLASKAFDNVKDKNIWDLQINNAKNLYFPAINYSPADEIVAAEAISKIDFQNLPQDGINLINKNKNIFRSDDYAYYLLAKAHIIQNKNSQAQKDIENAIKINPKNLTYKMERAIIFIKRNSYKSAERELNNIKKIAAQENIIDPSFKQQLDEQNYWLKFKNERNNPAKSKFYKAKYYEAKNEYDNALDVLNSISAGENKAYIYETIGNIYLKTRQRDKAKTNFLKALSLDKNNASAFAGIGEVYLLEGKEREALDNYGKSLSIRPESVDVKLKIAEIYENLGQEEEALNYYRAILLDYPLNYDANYKIGLMYLKAGDFSEAKKLFKKAVSVDPMFSLIWLNLAGIEISQKNYPEAERCLKAISYIDDKNPYYYYYTGLINKARGNFDSARENFDKAIELKPDFKEVNQALERL